MLHGFTPTSEGKPTTPTVNKSAKSQLARLLATENLSVEHKKIHTAMFDTKNRVLMLPIWDNMSGDLYDLLVGHEIGHALETPKDYGVRARALVDEIDPKNSGGITSFINVIEDARIEKLVKQRYPGLRRSFLLGYKELVDRNFFQIVGKDLDTYKFIDRINLHFKLGSLATINFSDEEKPMVDMVADAETWEDVVEALKVIYKYSKDKSETDRHQSGDQKDSAPKENGEKSSKNQNKKSKNTKEKKKPESDEKKDGDESDAGEPGEDDTQAGEDKDESKPKESGDDSAGTDGDDDGKEDSDSNSDGDGDGDDSDGEEEAADGEGSSGGSEGEDGDEEDGEDVSGPAEDDARGGYGKPTAEGLPEASLPASETDAALEEARKELAKFIGADIVYINTLRNTLKLDKLVVTPKEILKDFDAIANKATINPFIVYGDKAKEFRSENSRAISFMVKEFEMRKAADQYNRSSTARTGVIDTNKLHTYMFNDDIFRRITTLPGGKNHGFVMFIDWSGSMQENMPGTLDQLMNMVMFCRQVQIPFKVYGFTDGYARKNKSGGYFHTTGILSKEHNPSPKHGDVVMSDFNLLNFFDSNMTSAEIEKMFKVMIWLKHSFNYADPIRHDLPAGYGLSGTPLNQAIIAAMQIVPEFQRATKIQIVSTIFLTDGESNGLLGYYRDDTRNPGNNGMPYGCDVVVRDPITKAEVKTDSKLGSGEAVTKALLEILKERTGTRLIGYYLVSRWREVGTKFFKEETAAGKGAELESKFRTEKFVSCKTAGYDEYFIIPGGASLSTKDKELIVTGKSSAAITKQFMQYNKQKEVNRVILSRFVERIAK